MKIGVLADAHVGYFHGNRAANGVNIRESDVIRSFQAALENLANEGVEAILDLGDLANTPSPRKRAIAALIRTINEIDLPFYSVNGNHTLVRSQADIHLYELLESQCPKFHGFTEPGEALGGYMIPYGDKDEVVSHLQLLPADFSFIAGHWACSDVPYPGDHVPVGELPREKPVLLGHYHRRSAGVAGNRRPPFLPIYVGSTDKFAWGEWNNPTGAAIFEDGKIRFVDHQTREWVNLTANADNYLEVVRAHEIENAIVRLSIESTSEQYQSLDLVSVRKELAPSLEYQIRRTDLGATDEQEESQALSQVFSIEENWKEHIKTAKIPRGVKRKDVETRGLEALTQT